MCVGHTCCSNCCWPYVNFICNVKHLEKGVYDDPHLGEIEMIFWSSRIYLGLSASFTIPSETIHIQKTIQLPPGPSIHYQHLPWTISNIQYLPISSSDLQSLPSTTSIFLKLSATPRIFHHHSVTFRVYLPLSGSTSIFQELSATLSIFLSYSVSFRVFHW